MTRKTIGIAADFCGNCELEVEAQTGEHLDNPRIPSTVSLYASKGPCRFLYSMTAAGARDLAELLLDAARHIDTIDALEGAQ